MRAKFWCLILMMVFVGCFEPVDTNDVVIPSGDDDSSDINVDIDIDLGDDDSSDPTPEPEFEGDDAGECSDGADNDVDGFFDCSDTDCFGSPDCDEEPTPEPPVDTDGDGWVDADDCDDGDPDVHPGAEELCNGQDDDCDSFVDEGCGDDDDTTPEPELEGDDAGECEDGADNDWDGFFDCDDPDCIPSPDCVVGDDDDSAGDDDSDDDDATPPADTDSDGWIDTLDCAPTDPAVYPTAPESCDMTDSDCDGSLVDGFPNQDGDGLPDCVDTDDDGDGYGDVPSGGTDCNDSDPAINPVATEWCNDGIDQDCSGSDLVVDTDGDGYQDMVACPLNGDDCDDTEAGVHPFAPEVCGDGIDQDCWSGADDVCTSACTRQIVGSYVPASAWAMDYDDVVFCGLQVGVSVCGLAATMTDADVVVTLYGLQQAVQGATPTNQWVQSQGVSPLHTLEYRGAGNTTLLFDHGGVSLLQGALITWSVSDPAWSCKGAYAEPF